MSEADPTGAVEPSGYSSSAPASDLQSASARLALGRRRLALWRVAAILAFVLAVIAVVPLRSHGEIRVAAGPHLVRLKLSGVITDNADRLAAIAAAQRDSSVKAMLLEINSPGGTVGGGMALHDALVRFAKTKPLVAVMKDTAASAAYMAAVPSARIFASAGTLTGSIGVLMQTPDFSGLLATLGIHVDMLVSGPLKGQPSGVQPLSPAGRQMLQSIVDDYDTAFVEMVASGRSMPVGRVRELADGRPYTGRQAVANGLIDQIGDETAARAWLAQARHVSEALPIRALPRPERATSRLWWLRLLRDAPGGDEQEAASLTELVWNAVMPEVARDSIDARLLSGPVALWRP